MPSAAYDDTPTTSATSTTTTTHPLIRALTALLHTLHDPSDSTALYALLLFHLQSRPPAVLDRVHALLERARSRHEPLGETLKKAEERLWGLGEGVGAATAAATGGGLVVEVAMALGEVRAMVEELREAARERPASAVVLRYLEAAGACSMCCVCMYMCAYYFNFCGGTYILIKHIHKCNMQGTYPPSVPHYYILCFILYLVWRYIYSSNIYIYIL